MAGGIEKLNVKQIDAWIKRERARIGAGEVNAAKLFDGHGLFLTLTPMGTPVWRLRYRFGLNAKGAPRDRMLSIGEYPEITLVEARTERDKARALLRANQDPVVTRRVSKATANAATGVTFRDRAAVWLAMEKPGWAPEQYEAASGTITRHVTKYIGDWPIQSITAPVFAEILRRLIDPRHKKGPRLPTAQKVAFWCAKIFNLAKADAKFEGDNPVDVASIVLSGVKQRPGRRPAFLTWPELGDILRRARMVNLSSSVQMAHRLCAFTAARIGNVIAAEWPEFDLGEVPLWTIPRAKMKSQDRHHDHLVFLGPTIAAELRNWRSASGAPSSGYLFPAVAGGGEHITSEAISKAYRVTLGLKDKHSPHGWRSALSTLARDEGFDRDAVEMALDHIHDSAVVRAYDRGERRPERVKLATWWNEQLVNAERGTP